MIPKINIWDKENNYFLLLFFTTVIIVYFSPYVLLTRLFFLITLLIIYNSKKDHFWLAWLFVIVDAPGHLFAGSYLEDAKRIPVYPIFKAVSVSYYDLLILLYLFKAWSRKREVKINAFSLQSKIFIGIIIFYLVFTFIAYQINFIAFYRTVSPWILIYAIYQLMPGEQNFHKFNKLVFPFVLFAFLAQIYSFIEGQHLLTTLKGTEYHFKEGLSKQITEESDVAARNLYSMFIIIYSVTVAFVYYSRTKSIFPRQYLILVIIFGFLATILSGTRGFLLAIVTIIIGSTFIGMIRFNKLFQYVGIIILLFIAIFLLGSYSPVLKRQFELVTNRYETLLLLAQGDATAGGTLYRLTYRIPKIMEWINQSPLFGFGFSESYYLNADNDIGFHTMILNVGYIGVAMLYFLFLLIIMKIYKYSRMKQYKLVYQNSGTIFLIGLIGLMIFHLTTNIAFGLTPSGSGALHERYLIYGFLLNFFNVTINYSGFTSI